MKDYQTLTVLVVDDDIRLSGLLQRYLTEQGLNVVTVEHAIAMDAYLAKQVVDLVVLDWMLPQENGLSICQRLRVSHPHLAIIMLTARGEASDRIAGLEGGADDYLAKPFDPRELLARIGAVARRYGPTSNQGIRIGDLQFDVTTRALTRNGQALTLTSGEFALLKALIEHPNQPLSRADLAQLVHGRALGHADARSMDVQMSRLRKLIEKNPTQPRHLKTVWGYGYVFSPD
ncbi:MAG: response regulator [Methylophilaceae bacterium]|nr:response regulator [Methylophilaceae bacterium]